MSSKPCVSVIIPVYNSEKYLRQCLDSVLNQTLQNIEVICINDGSIDNSLDILKEYKALDKRLIIINQKNTGAGAARNIGLTVAKGEYLSFLDSDDFFELNMLEKSYTACKTHKLDFVVFRSDYFNEENKRYIPQYSTIRTDLLPKKKVFCYKDIKKDIFNVFVGWAWDKLFCRDFVQTNNLIFQEQRTTNDLLFVFSALIKAKRITVLDEVLAHHRISNKSSLSNTREKSWRCFYNALLALKDELKRDGIYNEVEQDYINYALRFSLWNLNTITGSSYIELCKQLKSEIFHKLGITKHDRNYFWHKNEYDQYYKIMNNSKLGLTVKYQDTNRSNLLVSLIRSIRNNGLKYAIYKMRYELYRK